MRSKTANKITYRIFINQCFFILILLFSLIAALPVFFIFFHIIANGSSAINISFLTKLPKPVGEEGGGVINAIIGTILLIILSSLISIPISIAAGIYLAEHKKGKLSSLLRLSIDVLQGTPSIILGIIAYIWIVRPMKHFSLLSGSVALSIIMIPSIVKSTEETLKLVPDHIREAALALGVPYYKIILKVMLPISMTGIITGILLSIARISGETAPLLFTAFGNPFINFNPIQPADALPLIIFNYAKSPYTEWHRLAWGASLILLILVITINLITRWITKKWKIQF